MKVQDVTSNFGTLRIADPAEINEFDSVKPLSLNPALHPDGGVGAHNFDTEAHGENDV